MVFNAMLKTCDTPNNFPCRLMEGAEHTALENERLAASPDHRQREQTDGGQSGTEHLYRERMGVWFYSGKRGGVYSF